MCSPGALRAFGLQLAVLLLSDMICGGLDSFLSVSEITVPQRLLGRAEENTESMIYAITIGGKKHFVYLTRQKFLPADFVAYINGNEDSSLYFQQMKTDCYYQGYILDHPNSAVTLSTCSGLRGVLEFVNERYVIEPLQFLHGFQHLVSKLEGESKNRYFLENDTDPDSMEEKNQKISLRMDNSKQIREADVQKARYMKLAVFVTKELFDSYSESVSAINENILTMISILNTKFDALMVRIFLSSLEIWTESNPIDMSNGTTADKLDRFISYTNNIAFKRRPYDIPLLLSVNGDVTEGRTYFGSIGSQQNGILALSSETIEKYSSVVAHLLGHSMGIFHDDFRNCKCSGTACIMHTNMGISTGIQTFSSCSVEDFDKFVSTFGVANCLFDMPNLKAAADPTLCGNKVVDAGEACDCGSASECQADPCCGNSCRLKGKALCAWGPCCENCKIRPRGTLCRAATNECDLPEYCSGSSHVCAEDVFQQNGNFCKDKKSYCYDGKCADRDAACQQYFGAGSRAADPLCFLEANALTDRFGNCGVNEQGQYVGCNVLSTTCGKLQCTYPSNLPLQNFKAAIIYYAPKGGLCASIDFMQKDKFSDPAWVPNGAMCGKEQMCLKQTCVNLTSLNNKCVSDVSCSKHGVCNSKGNCHCDDSWRPPTCSESGTGGSVDSGSRILLLTDETPSSSSSLQNWVLMSIGLAIPLICAVAWLVIKRKDVVKCFRRPELTSETEDESETDAFPTSSVTSKSP